MARQNDTELYFYYDGHVRVYHGDQTALPRHYVARERFTPHSVQLAGGGTVTLQLAERGA